MNTYYLCRLSGSHWPSVRRSSLSLTPNSSHWYGNPAVCSGESVTCVLTQEKDATPFEGGNVGVMCTQSTDEKLQRTSLWERYIKHLEPIYGETKVWSWGPDSGLLPCRVYTRHCVLAVQKDGVPAYVTDRRPTRRSPVLMRTCQLNLSANSFLDDTFLVDRTTTLRQHLEAHPEVMATEPPEEFRERYSG